LSDGGLTAIEVATLFVHTPSGRILCENDPPRSTGPRLYIGGDESGNVVRIRHDIADDVAVAIVALAADEPPLCDPRGAPVHLDAYRELLEGGDVSLGVTYVVPDDLAYSHHATLVCSGTAGGDDLLARVATDGMPPPLASMGYTTFWEPWCVALHGDEIASVVETVRDSPVGVEAGVSTVPALRGRGLAAAATFGWASHAALRDRVRFYSTQQTNVSSQRVAARLGLRFVGANVRLT
jgi:hypothetical protein